MRIRSCYAGPLCCAMLLVGNGISTAADPPVVEVCKPLEREVTDYVEFTGRTRSVNFVEIRARVTGYLSKANFKDGSDVKRGDMLFEIDPRPYQAELDKAQANVAASEARLKLADANFQRGKALQDKGGIAADELDKFAADRRVAEAEVGAVRASLAVAKLNLDFTKVHAPFDGRIGQRFVDPGGLVRGDETILATLASQDPMYVYFDMDERTALKLRRAATDEKGKSGGGLELTVRMQLADETGLPHKGKMDFMDTSADIEKGAVRARAIFPNKDGLMIPGLYAHVRVVLGEPHKALFVPSTSLATSKRGDLLYVVTEKNLVEERYVELGPLEDGLRAVNTGLKAGDWIVADLRQVSAGMTVQPKKTVLSDDKRK